MPAAAWRRTRPYHTATAIHGCRHPPLRPSPHRLVSWERCYNFTVVNMVKWGADKCTGIISCFFITIVFVDTWFTFLHFPLKKFPLLFQLPNNNFMHLIRLRETSHHISRHQQCYREYLLNHWSRSQYGLTCNYWISGTWKGWHCDKWHGKGWEVVTYCFMLH